jgi:hypothetical protein
MLVVHSRRRPNDWLSWAIVIVAAISALVAVVHANKAAIEKDNEK